MASRRAHEAIRHSAFGIPFQRCCEASMQRPTLLSTASRVAGPLRRRLMATVTASGGAHGVPVVLCADFDETMSSRDTVGLQFDLGARGDPERRARHHAVVQRLAEQYTREMRDFLKSSESAWSAQHNVGTGRGFNGGALRDFLAEYAATDLRSIRRVVQAGVLGGIKLSELVATAADSVELRPGCADVLAQCDALYVISANWSTAFVRAAVARGMHVQTPAPLVLSNELEMDAQDVTTGDIALSVQSPVDKARWVVQIRAAHAPACEQEPRPYLLYVGDSTNDLLALLEADVGVWIGPVSRSDCNLLLPLTARYGIDVQPLASCESLDECVENKQRHTACSGRRLLFTAEDWSELGAVITSKTAASLSMSPPSGAKSSCM